MKYKNKVITKQDKPKAERCIYIMPSGRRCRVYKQSVSKYCFRHDPAISKAEKKAASSKGGLVASNRIPPKVIHNRILSTSEQIRRALNEVWNLTRQGKMTQGLARTLTSTSIALMKSVEDNEMTKKLEFIQQIIVSHKLGDPDKKE